MDCETILVNNSPGYYSYKVYFENTKTDYILSYIKTGEKKPFHCSSILVDFSAVLWNLQAWKVMLSAPKALLQL